MVLAYFLFYALFEISRGRGIFACLDLWIFVDVVSIELHYYGLVLSVRRFANCSIYNVRLGFGQVWDEWWPGFSEVIVKLATEHTG